ncbi:MAG: alkaline phosphatase family protein [Desulfovibrio sp.]|nr:alkaline phosphatase family protein [Desulfovibrio sp.]
MNRAMLLLIDGLRADAARANMCFMTLLESRGLATFKVIRTVSPPVSKNVYATLATGLDPLAHGILDNDRSPAGETPTIFSRARDAGLAVAAAAHIWFAEICGARDAALPASRFRYDPLAPISYGLFYSSDSYPDQELFADAEVLRELCEPDLMLTHSMGVDWAGHRTGGESREYADAVRRADALLSRYLPVWMAAGYQILIMSDHGMNADGAHYDNSGGTNLVPVWGIGEAWTTLPDSPADVAPMLGAILGV